ncbi:putative E3 ubiquitin ligase protein [Dioscorea alata]|uniref:E3 ubiquitin ligase protein n=1 Tax=Dioscorea alata TaxID=55571 RepID=A0ACB7V5I1_DIOAL|nr:putative E3 ubiquitin ligase protein [Dioscorea alata]
MGSNARDKARAARKHRPKPIPPSAKPPASSATSSAAVSVPDPLPNPNPNPNLGSSADDPAAWGYCTEEQLEELLLKNLEFVYKEALSRLISLGYDEAVALKAILRSGHCYGSMDVLSNILQNAIASLNSSPQQEGQGSAAAAVVEPAGFSDLRHLEEYSLAGLVCLLQQYRPHLTRGDAMWCLLMADLHVGRANAIDVPSPELALCKLHAQYDRHTELSASAKSVLKRHAAALASHPSELPHPSVADASGAKDSEEDVVASAMKNLNLTSLEAGENDRDDPKMATIIDLCRQIQDLRVQVKERKEWAQQKALQAARKVSNDLMELRALRAEREENQRVRKGKQALEDTTMKKLAEMEAALRKASGQVDRANAEVRRLETENAEIRAEMEASKLSAAESAAACTEAARREKKCFKRLQVWEKQREKVQDEIAEERRKVVEVERHLTDVKEAQKRAEAKWKKEIKAKEHAIGKVDEERRAKEAAELEIKRKHEALRQKIELDFQRHKDDVQRLEEEYARLKAVAGTGEMVSQSSNAVTSEDTDTKRTTSDASSQPQTASKRKQGSSRRVNGSRLCFICLKEEVSVVLLPCAHQTFCVKCNEDHEKKAKTRCPACQTVIEQRVRVYGASS